MPFCNSAQATSPDIDAPSTTNQHNDFAHAQKTYLDLCPGIIADLPSETQPFTLRRDLLSVSRVWFISEFGSIHALNSQDLCYITIPLWQLTMSRGDRTKNPSRGSVSLHWLIEQNPRMERLRQEITLQSLPRWMERACKLDTYSYVVLNYISIKVKK